MYVCTWDITGLLPKKSINQCFFCEQQVMASGYVASFNFDITFDFFLGDIYILISCVITITSP